MDGAETIVASRVITPSREIARGAVRFSGGRIDFVGEQAGLSPADGPLHEGHLLIPGMIDLHLNGAGGADLSLDLDDGVATVGRTLARHGCTGYLATIITDRRPRLIETLRSLARRLDGTPGGARALGIHLEGPFINPARKGAHRPDCIQEPSAEAFEEFYKAAAGRLRMLTLAPEMRGALDLISSVRRRIPIVALGHSEADFDCGTEAIQRGANVAAHLFNAMASLHHRRPGLAAAILNSDQISAEIIADGIHVHPEMVRLVYRCKGPARVALVTDAVSAAGMPDGTYRVGNVEIEKTGDVCRDEHGSLAGSALQMDQGLRNLASWLRDEADAPLGELVRGAAQLPADLLGLSGKGRLKAGCDADLVLMDESLHVLKTWVEGRLVYDRSQG